MNRYCFVHLVNCYDELTVESNNKKIVWVPFSLKIVSIFFGSRFGYLYKANNYILYCHACLYIKNKRCDLCSKNNYIIFNLANRFQRLSVSTKVIYSKHIYM